MKRLNQMKNISSDQVAALSDDQAMFDRRFLEENSEFFRLDPNQNYSLLIVHLDLLKAKANVTRIGKDMHNIRVRSELSKNPFGFQGQQDSKLSSSASQQKQKDVNVVDSNKQQTQQSSANNLTDSTSNSAVQNELIDLINGNVAMLKMLDLKVDEDKARVSFNVKIKLQLISILPWSLACYF